MSGNEREVKTFRVLYDMLYDSYKGDIAAFVHSVLSAVCFLMGSMK